MFIKYFFSFRTVWGQEIFEKKQIDRENLARIAENTGMINEKMNSVIGVLYEIENQIGRESQLTLEQQRISIDLLHDIKKAILSEDDDKDDKINQVLKFGLDAGKQIAFPLMIEFIKYYLKSNGFPII